MPGKTKFAVVGFTKHRELAPFGQPEWDVHGMNALHYDMPLDRWPFTGWWQIHTREMVMRNGREDHIEWLRKCPLPIYVLDKREWMDIPTAVEVPRREIEQLWKHGDYHTSSVSWMVGYAILKKYKEIHVYGIDMASNTEYMFQRPACEAWLAYAEGLGIKTYTPPESDLFNTVAQYGFGEQSAFRQYLHGKVKAYMARVEQINQNLAQIRLQKRNLDEEFDTKERRLLKDLHHFEGQVIQVQDLLQNFTVPEGGGGSPYGVSRTEDLDGREEKITISPDGKQQANRIKESIDA